jgi:hypothetical protein
MNFNNKIITKYRYFREVSSLQPLVFAHHQLLTTLFISAYSLASPEVHVILPLSFSKAKLIYPFSI